MTDGSMSVSRYACVKMPCLMLEKAKSELAAAITQMADSDDRIICDHVREAAKLIEAVIISMDAVSE